MASTSILHFKKALLGHVEIPLAISFISWLAIHFKWKWHPHSRVTSST